MAVEILLFPIVALLIMIAAASKITPTSCRTRVQKLRHGMVTD